MNFIDLGISLLAENNNEAEVKEQVELRDV